MTYAHQARKNTVMVASRLPTENLERSNWQHPSHLTTFCMYRREGLRVLLHEYDHGAVPLEE